VVTVGAASNLAFSTYNQTAGSTTLAGGGLGGLSPTDSAALSFNGTNNFVDMGNPSSHVLDLGANATLEAWVNFAALPVNTFATIVSKDVGAGTTPKWIFGYSNNSQGVSNGLMFLISNPGQGVAVLTPGPWTPVVGQWYHLALVENG